MEPTPTSERSRSNGRGDAPDEPHRNGGAPDRDAGTGGVTCLARRIARFAASRIPVAELGWLAEQASAPAMRGNLKRSVLELKRRVEHEQLVEQAARRRARAHAA